MLKITHLSFTTKLFLYLLLLLMILLTLLQSYIWSLTKNDLYLNLGQKAQIQAKELAVIPSLIEYVQQKDTTKIAELVTDIFNQSDASYIVIGDNNAYRLFHTANSPINMPMLGGDNQAVMNGNSIITIREGSLGVSLRGKAPIFNADNQVVGIVSVGYMIDNISQIHKEKIIPFVIFCSILFLALFFISFFFTKLIKKQMFNLEPRSIALLVKSQKSIMESIFEGIIAIDLDYNITNINQSARKMLNISLNNNNLVNHNLSEFIKSTDFIYNSNNKNEDIHDHVCHFNDCLVIANRIRIVVHDKIQGWVITFRKFDEVNLLSVQLSQVTQYVDNLRALRHEHLNWMATLSGLIYMQRYQEAQEFITIHSVDNQKSLDFITQHFKVPAICGLLIGKFSKSHELGLKLVFDPACQLLALPTAITEIEFMSIVGNLLDNAFNASLKNLQGDRTVILYLSDATDEIVIEVSDHGCGINEKIRDSMFNPGVTSQNPKEHGIGLHLVSTYTQKANGYVTFDDNEPSGAIFSVFIPK